VKRSRTNSRNLEALQKQRKHRGHLEVKKKQKRQNKICQKKGGLASKRTWKSKEFEVAS
jgi:hypothetical protein